MTADVESGLLVCEIGNSLDTFLGVLPRGTRPDAIPELDEWTCIYLIISVVGRGRDSLADPEIGAEVPETPVGTEVNAEIGDETGGIKSA